jgi:hypothetical protein
LSKQEGHDAEEVSDYQLPPQTKQLFLVSTVSRSPFFMYIYLALFAAVMRFANRNRMNVP